MNENSMEVLSSVTHREDNRKLFHNVHKDVWNEIMSKFDRSVSFEVANKAAHGWDIMYDGQLLYVTSVFQRDYSKAIGEDGVWITVSDANFHKIYPDFIGEETYKELRKIHPIGLKLADYS